MKNINKILLPILLIFLGGGIGFILLGNKQTDNMSVSKDNSLNNPNSNNIKQNVDKTVADNPYKTLVINNHTCIGCGKCVMVDSEHFEMMGRKARVVSSNNLSSKNLDSAIKICPAGSISLI